MYACNRRRDRVVCLISSLFRRGVGVYVLVALQVRRRHSWVIFCSPLGKQFQVQAVQPAARKGGTCQRRYRWVQTPVNAAHVPHKRALCFQRQGRCRPERFHLSAIINTNQYPPRGEAAHNFRDCTDTAAALRTLRATSGHLTQQRSTRFELTRTRQGSAALSWNSRARSHLSSIFIFQ